MQNHQNNLVEDNLNLVYYIVSHNFPTYLKDEDVIQAGMEGLCKAAKTYNSDKGKFSTFAGVCIRRHIYKELNRRKHYQDQVSLNTVIIDDEGEISTLEDVIVGDEDIDIFQMEFVDLLNSDEVDAVRDKYNNKTTMRTNKHLRSAKRKWRKSNEE